MYICGVIVQLFGVPLPLDPPNQNPKPEEEVMDSEAL
jgi:hypothetical protein